MYSGISEFTTQALPENGILENLSSSSYKLSSTPSKIIALIEEGIDCRNSEMHSKALTKLEKALELSKNDKRVSKEVISCIRIEIGKVLYHFEQYKQSAKHFMSSIAKQDNLQAVLD